MQVIVCRASARYTGRIEAELSLGDVVIQIRDNGSVLVHSVHTRLPPRNWMPEGSRVSESGSVIVAEHAGRVPVERLEIYIDEIYHRIEHEPGLEAKISLIGAEKEFADLVADDLTLLEDGLELIAREYRTSAGPIDIMAREKESGTGVVIEMKRRRVDAATCWQARRYLEALASSPEWEKVPLRALVVGPVLARPASALLDALQGPDIRYCRLDFKQVPKPEGRVSVPEQKELKTSG